MSVPNPSPALPSPYTCLKGCSIYGVSGKGTRVQTQAQADAWGAPLGATIWWSCRNHDAPIIVRPGVDPRAAKAASDRLTREAERGD